MAPSNLAIPQATFPELPQDYLSGLVRMGSTFQNCADDTKTVGLKDCFGFYIQNFTVTRKSKSDLEHGPTTFCLDP